MNQDQRRLPEPHEEGSDQACAVLLALSHYGPLSAQQIARVVGLDKHALVPVLRGLKERDRIAWDVTIGVDGAWRLQRYAPPSKTRRRSEQRV